MHEAQQNESSAIRPLVDAIKAELRGELLAELRGELHALHAERPPEKVLLSLADLGRRYGVGRIELKRMIASGRLPAVERIARGGRRGVFVHLADAERVLAGRKDQTKQPGAPTPAPSVEPAHPPSRTPRRTPRLTGDSRAPAGATA